MRWAVIGLVALGLVVGLLGTAVVGSAMAMFGIDVEPTATSAATSKIPPAMLALYQEAAATCPGLPWTVLAAIGTVESDNGQSTLPGVHSGSNVAGAEGPMQFEPGTFAEYDEPIPPGGADPPSPYDPTDAVYAAARLLCANGGVGGTDLAGAVYAYNHSASYVTQVLALAQSLAAPTPAGTPVSDAGAVAARVGAVPDRHALRLGRRDAGCGLRLLGARPSRLPGGRRRAAPGGSGPIRRDAEAGRRSATAPGDLVFFGAGPSAIDHVGIYVGIVDGDDVMVDAPYTGADVRAEAFPATPGADFGSLLFVGATRP